MMLKYTYTGGTPGADADEYVLYDSIVFNNARGQILFEKLYIDLVHGAAGDLIVRKTTDGGVTYHQISIEENVTPVVGDSSKFLIYLGGLVDAQVVWKNAGVAQSTWSVSVGEAPEGV